MRLPDLSLSDLSLSLQLFLGLLLDPSSVFEVFLVCVLSLQLFRCQDSGFGTWARLLFTFG